jgi:hypothetical protein
MSRGFCLAALSASLGLLASGCVGRYFNPEAGAPEAAVDAGGETRKDGPPSDGPVVVPDASGCSPSGTPTSCDPVLVTGCPSGSCYVTVNGIVCVCPAGTTATGAACSTTVQCAPGNVCAGTSAPGLCRKTCDPQAAQCGTGETCTAIQGYTQVGYCEPN